MASRAIAVALLGAAPACHTGDASIPSDGVAHVGPSPLRRLSNEEYLNALHDLFPEEKLALPPLPADVPVAGFQNAIEAQAPSDVRIARYEAIANLYAAAVTTDDAHVVRVTGCHDWSSPSLADACAHDFVDRTAGRIFRRPIDGDERARFVERFAAWEGAIDFQAAVRLSIASWLESPQFLYRVERPAPSDVARRPGTVAPLEPYAMASRLSFFLWASTPDDALLDAASRHELRTDAQLRAQAERMLDDDRARRVLFGFHRQWLGLDRILLDEHAARTAAVDAAWTPATQAAAFTESELFVENTLSRGGTLGDLLTSRRAWVNAEAARIYGLPRPDGDGFAEVDLPEERAGLLTRVSFLAGYSHRGATSPPVRGNGIELRLLCHLPMSPPPGADLSQPKIQPGQGPQTNRQLFEARTSPPQCQTCHAGLNGFGFGLESYDAAGHYRTTDDGLTIDSSGTIHGTDVDGPYRGGVELSFALARSEMVHRCATSEMVRFALGRAPVDVEASSVDDLGKRFFANGGDVRQLLTDVVLSPTFRSRILPDMAAQGAAP